MSKTDLTNRIKAEARRLGFASAGVCPAVEPTGATRLREWLDRGYAGEMHYLERREEAYRSPLSVLDGVKSIVMLAMNYRTVEPRVPQSGEGRISRYAWGNDYHDLIRERLNQLGSFLAAELPSVRSRGVVDSAPLLEREFAELAGLGWVGKNTLLLDKHLGSWFFLAALLTDAELAYDVPHAADHCGTCRACLDACPTDAFVEPYVLDARRCISYLTIEHRSSIPNDLRAGMGDWLFGCDICQDVCPWNHRAPLADEVSFEPRPNSNPIELAALFHLDEAAFRNRFRGSPLWRPKRRGMLRNAAIVLGNQRCREAAAALMQGLNDAEALVRGACAWAMGEIGGAAALQMRLKIEDDEHVRDEITLAILIANEPRGPS
jgi:epoxyqueuosine reductase